jgi:hypothetical protein
LNGPPAIPHLKSEMWGTRPPPAREKIHRFFAALRMTLVIPGQIKS